MKRCALAAPYFPSGGAEELACSRYLRGMVSSLVPRGEL